MDTNAVSPANLPLMRSIPAGEFTMGSDAGRANEAPAHTVWVDAFCLAAYPVTRSQYSVFVQATGHRPPPFWHEPRFAHPNQPVVGPNWHDAVAYCAWLADRTGLPYLLPTEAEREKAARGGRDGSAYPWGDDLPADHTGGPDASLPPVGDEGPNGYGLYNMAAGVHEWCADRYAADYYRQSPCRNPTGPPTGPRRVARGGSWRHAVRFARCAARSSLPPDRYFSDFGFRVACNAS